MQISCVSSTVSDIVNKEKEDEDNIPAEDIHGGNTRCRTFYFVDQNELLQYIHNSGIALQLSFIYSSTLEYQK